MSHNRSAPSRRPRHLTYANVMSTLAFVMAMGGSLAVAAGTITSSQIKDSTIRSVDIRASAVRSSDIAASAVGSNKIANASVGALDLAAVPVATAERSTTLSIATGFTGSEVTLPSERVDNASMHAASAARIYAPVAGTYLGLASASWAPFDGPAFLYIQEWSAGGVTLTKCETDYENGDAAAVTGPATAVTCVRHLAAGESMSAMAGQLSGFSRSLYTAGLSMHRIGS